jgi:hypothetical protein
VGAVADLILKKGGNGPDQVGTRKRRLVFVIEYCLMFVGYNYKL